MNHIDHVYQHVLLSVIPERWLYILKLVSSLFLRCLDFLYCLLQCLRGTLVYFIHLLTLAIWDNKKWLELQLSVKMKQNSRSKIKASQLYCTVKMTLFFSLML